MRMLAGRYPGYGWETNVGYTTAEHGAALTRLGATPHHRRSFEPVRLALGGGQSLLDLMTAGAMAADD
jgi:ribonuclease HII